MDEPMIPAGTRDIKLVASASKNIVVEVHAYGHLIEWFPLTPAAALELGHRLIRMAHPSSTGRVPTTTVPLTIAGEEPAK